jgi:hypothetical protein
MLKTVAMCENLSQIRFFICHAEKQKFVDIYETLLFIFSVELSATVSSFAIRTTIFLLEKDHI